MFLYTGMTHVKELRTIEEKEIICTITKEILKINHLKLMQGTRVKGSLGKGDTHSHCMTSLGIPRVHVLFS